MARRRSTAPWPRAREHSRQRRRQPAHASYGAGHSHPAGTTVRPFTAALAADRRAHRRHTHRHTIFSQLYFFARAASEGSSTPPRRRSTRWSVDSARSHAREGAGRANDRERECRHTAGTVIKAAAARARGSNACKPGCRARPTAAAPELRPATRRGVSTRTRATPPVGACAVNATWPPLRGRGQHHERQQQREPSSQRTGSVSHSVSRSQTAASSAPLQ